LFFRGSEPLPFGAAIRPVRELIDYLLTGIDCGADPGAALSECEHGREAMGA